MKIIHGFHDICGIASALRDAERALGHDSRVAVWNRSRHGHGTPDIDYGFAALDGPARTAQRHATLSWLLDERPDVLHLHMADSVLGMTLLEGERSNSREDVEAQIATGLVPLADLDILTAAGIRIIATFHGCDVRRRNSGPICERCTWAACETEEKTRRARIDRIRAVAEVMFVTTPDLLAFVPDALLLPQAVPDPMLDDGEFVARRIIDIRGDREERLRGRAAAGELRIGHFPSNPERKGTPAILDALRQCGFTIDHATDLPHAELLLRLAGVDVLVEQLYAGWYGVTAVEAMAMGIPVITCITRDALALGSAQMKPLIKSAIDAGAIWPLGSHPILALDLRAIIGDLRREIMLCHAREHWQAWHDPMAIATAMTKSLEPEETPA